MKYILQVNDYCHLINSNISPQNVYHTQKNIINNITNDIIIEPLGLTGFYTRIEPAGCTGEVTSQENHVLGTTGGTVEPKNIVIQTNGSGNTFGSFFRDDTLTNPKGDVRGSGANDLSVSRELCSQVASGELSAILGGINNTASGDLSVVVGGSNNISSGSNSTIIGGTQNVNNGISSTIITGVSNEVLSGGSGFNVIGSGNNNRIIGDYNVITSGSRNNISNSNTNYSVILSGSNNLIQDASFSWIGAGNGNRILSGNYNVISGGANCLNQAIEYSSIGNGFQNSILNGRYNSIASGCNNVIDGTNTNFCGIFVGTSNQIVMDASYCCIMGGLRNGITGGTANSIVAGSNNVIGLSNQGFNFIGAGTANALNGGFNAIVAGSNNRIDSSSSIYNAIVAGTNNTIFGSISNSFIGAGSNNTINGANNGAIIAGISNNLSGNNSTIAGGTGNNISIQNSFVCGEGLQLTQAAFPSAAFGRFNLEGITGATGGSTGSNRIFMVGNGTAGNRTNAFSVTQDGVCIAQLAFATGGADFAEYFESHSKYTSKLPCCESVVLIDDRFIGKTIDQTTKQFVNSENGFTASDIGKIMVSSDVPEDIEVFGVIVENSGYIGNSYDEEWQGKYERDELNNIIYQDEIIEYEEQEYNYTTQEIEEPVLERIEHENGTISYIEKINKRTIQIKNPILEEYRLYDEAGEFIEYIKKPKVTKKTRIIRNKKLSSNYDPNLIYIPRTDRTEWNLVALLGQVMIKEGQRVNPKWSKMNKINDITHKYLIK